jgi:hypothetical protein
LADQSATNSTGQDTRTLTCLPVSRKMIPASYAIFSKEQQPGVFDRTGGLPTHLPINMPICEDSGREMAFLAQIYCSPERLVMKNTLCIHLYQCLGVDEGENLLPVVLKLPLDAPLNIGRKGTIHPGVSEFNIEWETKEDPDAFDINNPFNEVQLALFQTKIGGLPAFPGAVKPGERFLLQIKETPAGFNFGGLMLLLKMDENSQNVRYELM